MSESVWVPDQWLAGGHRAVALSDSVNLPQPMGIYCNVAGTVSVVDPDDIALTYTVTAGQMIPVIVKRVNATGTSVAANTLIGLVAS